jgi:hypothetical protein
MLRAAFSGGLDGEGILQAFKVLFQTLNAPAVVGQDVLLNAIQPAVDLGDILTHCLDIILAGHGFTDKCGEGCPGQESERGDVPLAFCPRYAIVHV